MRYVQAALILLLGFWVYTPALEGEWLFDDQQAVLNNPVIHRASGWWTVWWAPPGPDYFPLKDSVQWLQWHLWGSATLGYHLTNIALHLLGAFLIWRLLAVLGVRLAWLGGLIFAVHPCNVESVAWICELKNTLSLPLLLAAMLAYLRFERDGNRLAYFAAIAAFLASMLSKTSGVMLPVILLLETWWRHGKIRAIDVRRSLPFFAISGALGWVTVLFQHNVPPGGEAIESLDPLSRLLCAGLMAAFYLAKSFFPIGLDIVYFRWNVEAAIGWEILSWALIAVSLIWLATRRETWARHALFGYLFFLINLVPVLGFLRIIWSRYAWTADHFLYLPLIGLIGLAVAGASSVYHRSVHHERFLLALPLALIVAAMALGSHSYAGLFRKSTDLWTYNLDHNPASWLGHNNLAVALAADNDLPGAIHEIQLSLAVKPNQALAYINWGNALIQVGRPAGAAKAYRAALALRPDSPLAHYQLGNALAQTNQYNEAIAEYEAALRINPEDAQAHNNLASVDINLKKIPEALAEGQRAVELDPAYSDARYNLGLALGQAGRMPEAVEQLRAAAKLSPDDAAIEFNWATALHLEGHEAEAVEHYRRAGELDPRYAPDATRDGANK